MQANKRPEKVNTAASTFTQAASTGQAHRCQILAKKGLLTLRNITTDLVLVAYSREFQLGVLFHLPVNGVPDSKIFIEDQAFAQSAMAILLTEFQALGVRGRDLITSLVGGSDASGATTASISMVKRTLRTHGLSVSASDLGGSQTRSIWLDVESGRIIIRSEPRSEPMTPATQSAVALIQAAS